MMLWRSWALNMCWEKWRDTQHWLMETTQTTVSTLTYHTHLNMSVNGLIHMLQYIQWRFCESLTWTLTVLLQYWTFMNGLLNIKVPPDNNMYTYMYKEEYCFLLPLVDNFFIFLNHCFAICFFVKLSKASLTWFISLFVLSLLNRLCERMNVLVSFWS